MSPAAAPPGPARPAVTGFQAPADAEALFKEAKRRRRRRRLAGLAAGLVLVAAVAIGIGGTGVLRGRVTGDAGNGPGTTSPGAGIAPGTSVAWVDFHRHLHLGNVVTGSQRVIAKIKAYPALSLAQAGRRLYWVDHGGAYVPALHRWSRVIRYLDLATGQIRMAGPGEAVFPAADGRHVFVALTDTSLYEFPAAGSGVPRPRRLPPGWFMPQGEAIAVGNGILVQSVYPLAGRFLPHKSHTFAVWYPRSGTVRPVIRGYVLTDAIGPAGARGGLLAWLPISCTLGQNCRMRITSLRTRSTRLVRSPIGLGFTGGGAFSPNGRWLAVFVNQPPGRVPVPNPSPPGHRAQSSSYVTVGPDMSQLALIDTRTGVLHLVPGTRAFWGSWVRWLPDGRHLLAGGYQASYLVNAPAMTARTMYFLPGRQHGRDRAVMDTGDINNTAALVPPRR